MNRPIRYLAIFPLLILPGGCAELPLGIGSNHEVVVIADDEEWARYGRLLEKIFEKVIWTPQEERVFTVKRGSTEEFDFYRLMKNVVLISPLEGGGKTAEVISSLLSKEANRRVREGSAFVFFKRDVWAREQAMMILTAQDGQSLETRLQQNEDQIFQIMEDALNEKIEAWLYKGSEQEELPQRLLDQYGWSMRLADGYYPGLEVPDEKFVWLRKQRPHRWIFVWWEETQDSIIDDDWCLAKRNEIGERFYEGDTVIQEHLLVEETTFNGQKSIRLSGLWKNEDRGAGGPFRCYGFFDEHHSRRYLIDVAVFAPGVEKEPYLRQVDIIAHTFTTRGR